MSCWPGISHVAGTKWGILRPRSAPLEGTEQNGGVAIMPQGVTPTNTSGYWLALAPNSGSALLGWSGTNQTRLQQVLGTTPAGNAIVMPDDPPAPSITSKKALVRWQDGWWMALLSSLDTGIESVWLSDSAVVSRSVLVPHDDCRPSCLPGENFLLDVREFWAVRHQDELWFGFWDLSDNLGVNSYRIFRIRDGCVYKKLLDINHDR